jgi:trans-aconitate 2-methyltransferase
VSPHEWDAEAYTRVAVPHLKWGRAVLDRMGLRGDERVLDAGCGSGRVTALLAERVPRGHVVAVDASEAMVAEAREAAGPNVEVHRGDLLDLRLDEPVDAVFSAAVFHWIRDHDALFASLHANLRPGGRLAAHCGGSGNVARLIHRAEEVYGRPPYREHFEGWRGEWNFASPEDTTARLRRAGFDEVRCWLEPAPIDLGDDPEPFMRTVTCADHLDRLPPELHDQFVADVRKVLGDPAVIDFVRLQIDARASLA